MPVKISQKNKSRAFPKVRDKWDELYKQRGLQGKYPNEDVIRFIQKYFPDEKARPGIKILDWGCGSGRHAAYLAREGFLAYAAEVSETAVGLTKLRLKNEKLKAVVSKLNGARIPYPDGFFDAIIECAALQHNTRGQIKYIISEMRRILKPGGRVFSWCKAKEDSLYRQGEKIEPNTFYLKKSVETPTIIHFFDKKEITSLWREFKNLEIEYTERTADGLERKISHYLVTALK